MRRSLALVVLFLLGLGTVAACGSGSTATATTEHSETIAGTVPDEASGVRLVAPATADEIRTDPPAGLVILDVRTPEEFAEGHIEGATMLDFYEPDFAAEVAELDPEQPYVLYCRSGNRSGQTATLMAELGFTDVAEVDGGIVAWQSSGLPVVR